MSYVSRARGVNLIEVMVATVIIVLGVILVGFVLTRSVSQPARSEPADFAQAQLGNLQTRLEAIVAYDTTALQSLHSGQVITLQPPATPTPVAGATPVPVYPSDAQPITVTIDSITPQSSTAESVALTYTQGGITGKGTITLAVRAMSCATPCPMPT